METVEAIKQRTSIRQYSEKPVPKELLVHLVDMGRRAPTAVNRQPWEFIIITKKEKLGEIADITDHGRFIQDAAACIVVYCKETKYYLEDGCAAVENILLAATDSGLAACWVAGDKKTYVEKMELSLNVPQGYKLIALIPIGYPLENYRPREKRSVNDLLHWEIFKK